MINISTTFIKGLVIFEPTIHKDDRGYFFESFRDNEYNQYCDTLVQDNVSVSKRHVLKGLHYHKKQSQLISIAYGRVYDVVVDLRPDSETFKRHYALELDHNNPKQVCIPKGCAHGLYVQSEYSVITYKCSNYYDTSDDLSVLWNDPDLGITWPITDAPILSTKDAAGVRLTDVKF